MLKDARDDARLGNESNHLQLSATMGTPAQNVARETCDRMAEGETLTTICKTPGMPGYHAVRRWWEETGNTIGDQTFEAAFRVNRDFKGPFDVESEVSNGRPTKVG